MSFNAWLRDLVYGRGNSVRRVNSPMRHLPAAVTGTTWQGTGFEEPPAEPVELDEAELPWELQDETDITMPTTPDAKTSPVTPADS